MPVKGLPLWLSWQRIRLQCGRPGFDPRVGKIPWRRERLPTPVFWPGAFHGLYSLWGLKESDATERLPVSLVPELRVQGLTRLKANRLPQENNTRQMALFENYFSVSEKSASHPTYTSSEVQRPAPSAPAPLGPSPPASAFPRRQSASLWPKQHILQRAGLSAHSVGSPDLSPVPQTRSFRDRCKAPGNHQEERST